ncbi:hypothetical protein Tco_0690957 [Tanacetum coccineum]
MASSQTSSINTCKKPKINIKHIWKNPILIDLTKDDDITTPPLSSKLNSSTPPNDPIKTPSTRGTSSSLLFIPSRPNSSPIHSSQSTNPYLEDIMGTPPRVAHPPPPQNQDHQPMDVTI